MRGCRRQAGYRQAGGESKACGSHWVISSQGAASSLSYRQTVRVDTDVDLLRNEPSAGPDWAALVEALRIQACIPGVDRNRRVLLDRILGARIPDEFAKTALLRALAGDRKPDRRSASPIDLEELGAA